MTTRFAWASLVMLVAILLETWCGRLGLLIAGWPLAAIYLGVALGPHWGTWFGLAGCVAAEIMLGRSSTALPLVALLFPLIQFWRRHGDRRYLLIQMLPAGVAGVLYCLWTLTMENWHGPVPTVDVEWALLLLGAGAAASCLGGPIAWRLLDLVALIFGLPRFYHSAGISGTSDNEEASAT
jgi:hypothetical protein